MIKAKRLHLWLLENGPVTRNQIKAAGMLHSSASLYNMIQQGVVRTRQVPNLNRTPRSRPQLTVYEAVDVPYDPSWGMRVTEKTILRAVEMLTKWGYVVTKQGEK